mmetsp:Transcript_25415/g.41541  ORF Transcript_25415/g.41541 Transcript_25415/m.41541 type:complete len:205 (-) Transcript_25415:39-653(-)
MTSAEGEEKGEEKVAEASAASGPEARCRVFVRGFDHGTTDEALKAHCGAAGTIVKLQRQSKIAVVLTYSSAEEAEKAVSTLDRTVMEGNIRYIDVKLDEGPATGRTNKKTQKEKEYGPSGPDLPRQRVSDTPVAGSVLHFYGNIGWLKLNEPIDHPDLGKHNGKIYVHKKDLQGMDSLEKGADVAFYLYADSCGLGAEEVTLTL